MDAESQVIPHMEGQFITYTCPPGFVLSGPNVSECTENGRWEPDPGQVDCIGDNADNGAIIIMDNNNPYYCNTCS